MGALGELVLDLQISGTPKIIKRNQFPNSSKNLTDIEIEKMMTTVKHMKIVNFLNLTTK